MLKRKIVAILLVVVMVTALVPIATTASTGPTPQGVTAQAAIVIDFDTGEVLYARNANSRRVPASMTKTMTAFIAYEEIAAGNLTLSTRVRISANAARMSENNPGSRLLRAGAYYTVEDLIFLAMLPSSNRACIALAEHISGTEAAFVRRMNETAADLGIYTAFTNSHGAHDHYTTAYAMGRLVYEFIHRYPDILRITNTASRTIGGQNQTNTNRFIHNRQVAGLDGFKTGTLPRAGFCLQATATRGGRRIITVVMNSPNNDRRFADTRILLDFGFAEAARRDAQRRDEAARLVFVELNGSLMTFDVPPRIEDGRTLVPMRAISEAVGADVLWEADRRGVTVTKDDTVIELILGSREPMVDGRVVLIDVPATLVEGRVFVPLRFVMESLGVPFTWDDETRTIVINTDADDGQPEDDDDGENEMNETQALATLLFLARMEAIDDNFMLLLSTIIELVNFYLNVDEPVIIPENMVEYAEGFRAALENSDSEIYAFWDALGDDGVVLGADGVEPSGGEWPEWDQLVLTVLELREIVAQVNE